MNIQRLNPDVKWVIYALIDPLTTMVRYVGFTVKSLKTRIISHMSAARTGVKTRKDRWLMTLENKGLYPIGMILEEGRGNFWQSKERHWIAFYRNIQGYLLTNLTDGGEGNLGYIPTAETRILLGNKSRGHKKSPETLERMRQSNLGRKMSPEAIAKMRGRVAPRDSVEKSTAAKRHPVICIDTGIIYISMMDAARSMGVCHAAIRQAIKTRGRCCGFYWKKITKENLLCT